MHGFTGELSLADYWKMPAPEQITRTAVMDEKLLKKESSPPEGGLPMNSQGINP